MITKERKAREVAERRLAEERRQLLAERAQWAAERKQWLNIIEKLVDRFCDRNRPPAPLGGLDAL